MSLIYRNVLRLSMFYYVAAAAASLQSCSTLCDPIDGSQPGFPSLGFSKQEHWTGLPFPSPMHESEKWKWSRSVVSDSSDPMNCSPPGSSVHGIFQAKVLEWGAIAFSVSYAAAKSLQSCPTLCDPIDGSPPGSPVPGILQARTLEWVAISFSNAWNWEAKVKSLVMVHSLWPHGLQPTRLLCPWDFPGKSTGVGCHCLLQQSML